MVKAMLMRHAKVLMLFQIRRKAANEQVIMLMIAQGANIINRECLFH
jgi:hypothetical protein